MSPVRPRQRERFTETTLVIFTSLAIGGAGLLAADLLLHLGGTPDQRFSRFVLAASAIMIGTGLMVSTAHLGKMRRAWRALSRTGRSTLSTEVLLATVTPLLALAGLAAGAGVASTLFEIAAGVGGLLLLIALGYVYDLRGQQGWRGPATRIPLSQGLAFGMLAVLLFSDLQTAYLRPAAVAFILLDMLFHLLRWRRLDPDRHIGTPAYFSVFAQRHLLLLLRLLFGGILPLGAAATGSIIQAVVLYSGGIMLDRFLFYGLGFRHDHEAEIEHVERLIRS